MLLLPQSTYFFNTVYDYILYTWHLIAYGYGVYPYIDDGYDDDLQGGMMETV